LLLAGPAEATKPSPPAEALEHSSALSNYFALPAGAVDTASLLARARAIDTIERAARGRTPESLYDLAWVWLDTGRVGEGAEILMRLRRLAPEGRRREWNAAAVRALIHRAEVTRDAGWLLQALDVAAADPALVEERWMTLVELGWVEPSATGALGEREANPVSWLLFEDLRAVLDAIDSGETDRGRELGQRAAERWAPTPPESRDGVVDEALHLASQAIQLDPRRRAAAREILAAERAYRERGDCPTRDSGASTDPPVSPVLDGLRELRTTVCLYFSDAGAVRRRVEELRRSAGYERSAWLAAQVEWMSGVAAVTAGDPGRAVDDFDRALGYAAQLGDRAIRGGIASSRAEALLRRGDHRGAQLAAVAAIRETSRGGGSARAVNAWLLAGLVAREVGLESVAAELEARGVEIARGGQLAPPLLAAVVARAAEGRWHAGRDREARELLQEARTLLAGADGPLAARVGLDARLAALFDTRVGVSDVAMAELEEAYRHIGQRERLRLVALARARHLESEGDRTAALAVLRRALGEIEAGGIQVGRIDPVTRRLALEAAALSELPFDRVSLLDAAATGRLGAASEVDALAMLSQDTCWIQAVAADPPQVHLAVGRGTEQMRSVAGGSTAGWSVARDALASALAIRLAPAEIRRHEGHLRDLLAAAWAEAGCEGARRLVWLGAPELSAPHALLGRALGVDEVVGFPHLGALARAIEKVRAAVEPAGLVMVEVGGESALPQLAEERRALLRAGAASRLDTGGARLHVMGHHPGRPLAELIPAWARQSAPAEVVLNLCRGAQDRDEGAIDPLVWRWLHEGSGVVWTSVDIADAAAAAFAVHFYAAPGSLPAAVARTRRQLAASGDGTLAHPSSWAAYEVWGALDRDWLAPAVLDDLERR
jgi:tetratricopeptide (TPR) repeat protein